MRLAPVGASGGVANTGLEDPIVSQVRAGNDRAFDRMVAAQGNAMRRYAASLVNSLDDADDVVQAVWIRLWRKRASWVVRTSVTTYLMSAVRHEALNRLRSTRSRTQAETALAHEVAVRQALVAQGARDADIGQMDFSDTIRVLTPRQREAVALRFQCGMTVPQVASIMGISPKAAEVYLTRAMTQLRALFTAR